MDAGFGPGKDSCGSQLPPLLSDWLLFPNLIGARKVRPVEGGTQFLGFAIDCNSLGRQGRQ